MPQPKLNIAALRQRYSPRQDIFGQRQIMRHPPGGRDVCALCDEVDRLEAIIREIQRWLPAEQQNEVEVRLWRR